MVLTEIVKTEALPTEDMFPLTCSVIEQASTERSRTSSPNGRIFQFLFTVACLTATTVIAVIILLLREVAGSFRSHSCFTGAPVSLRALSGLILHLHLEATCLLQLSRRGRRYSQVPEGNCPATCDETSLTKIGHTEARAALFAACELFSLHAIVTRARNKRHLMEKDFVICKSRKPNIQPNPSTPTSCTCGMSHLCSNMFDYPQMTDA